MWNCKYDKNILEISFHCIIILHHGQALSWIDRALNKSIKSANKKYGEYYPLIVATIIIIINELIISIIAKKIDFVLILGGKFLETLPRLPQN